MPFKSKLYRAPGGTQLACFAGAAVDQMTTQEKLSLACGLLQTGQSNRMNRCQYFHCNCDNIQLYKQTNSSSCYYCSASQPERSALAPAGSPLSSSSATHRSLSHCAICVVPLLPAGHRPRLPRKHAADRTWRPSACTSLGLHLLSELGCSCSSTRLAVERRNCNEVITVE